MGKLGVTKDFKMVTDRYNSHLHEGVNSIIEEALSLVDTKNQEFLALELDLKRVIGINICVPTSSGDEIVYARRPKRNGHTRFVKNREGVPCKTLVVVLKKIEDKNFDYVLVTSFVGTKPELEPWDPKSTQKSIDFWSNHALVWGESGETLSVTETADCPW